MPDPFCEILRKYAKNHHLGTEVPDPSVLKKLSVMHSISVCLITEKYVMMQRIISR